MIRPPPPPPPERGSPEVPIPAKPAPPPPTTTKVTGQVAKNGPAGATKCVSVFKTTGVPGPNTVGGGPVGPVRPGLVIPVGPVVPTVIPVGPNVPAGPVKPIVIVA